MSLNEDAGRGCGDLTFEEYKDLANKACLTDIEKVGFPTSYREGREEMIFQDILYKLDRLRPGAPEALHVLDVGPGCSKLPKLLIEHCVRGGYRLVLIDSEEMLRQLPGDGPGMSGKERSQYVAKIVGEFPKAEVLAPLGYELATYGHFDVVLCYSLLHMVFQHANFYGFFDSLLQMLAPGGQLLIGDIANASKRRRYFESEEGRRAHRLHTGDPEAVPVIPGGIQQGRLDDAVILGLLGRARAAGFDAYVMPQVEYLTPLSPKREDMLIVRPK